MMKQGVRWLLVCRTIGFSGVGEKFSDLNFLAEDLCCISWEDVMRFLIEILGRLAPVPLTDIRSLGAVTERVCVVDHRQPARDAVSVLRQNAYIQVVAVVETVRECHGTFRVVGEIRSFRLRKCDYLRRAWALGNLTAGEFVSLPENYNQFKALISFVRRKEENKKGFGEGFSKDLGKIYGGILKSRNVNACLFDEGKNALLTCRPTNCLAAVMAQMLSHGATHVWVTAKGEANGKLVGIVTYLDILRAVTKPPNSLSA